MIGSRWHRLRARGPEAGSGETIEAVIWVPVLVLILVLVVIGGQVSRAASRVDTAAAAAARAASSADTPEQAQTAGLAAAQAALADRCTDLQVTIDVSQFGSSTPGAAVTATVSCSISLAAAVPGLPGTKTTERRATSPVDVLRENR